MSNPATGYPAGYRPHDPDRTITGRSSFGAKYDVSGFCFGEEIALDTSAPAPKVDVPPPFSMEKHIYGVPQDKPWPKIGDTCCKCNGGKYLGLSDMFGTDLDCDACGHHIFVCAEGLREEVPKIPRKRVGTNSCGPR